MRGNPILLAAVAVLTLSASTIPPGALQGAGAVEMQVEHIITLSIGEYNRAMEAGDAELWLKYFTDNVTRDGLLSVQTGKAEFSEYYRWEFATFQAKYIVKKMFVSGRTAVVVFSWDAVHRPSGRSLRLDMAGVYELAASGKFESVSFYYDSAKAAKFLEETGTASQ
jgi:hypothetical protein